ncbi:MAG TPA: aminotransferase class V-fold PLP-dependent enzyme [Ignavibacteriaceae bacterium]|nr:aminotransferase class V-fold PLP-dependent enzyme [Ignavibacteriaceae bacterium]
MIDKIKLLEKEARKLEPASKEREGIRNKVIDYTENFLEDIYNKKAFVTSKEKGIGIYDSPISEKPIKIEKALKIIEKNVDTPNLNPASGGHLGYIPGGGIYLSSLGDYMADVTNRFAGIFFASPGAVRMENMLIRWMADVVGYPKSAGGNLASGGSVANLIAITTARDAKKLKSKNFHKAVVYLSKHTHHCIDKSLRIAGLGDVVKRYISLDEKFRLIPEEIEKAILKDKKTGLIPWLVIASAGTTDIGAIDPLMPIGKIAKKHNLWYHIDGAYGGFFVLSETGKKKLKGLSLSDSVVIDPHKGLFVPYGLGVVLVKNVKHLAKSHYYQANYMQDALSATDELSPADLSAELTKHFRGLRLWLPLKLHGLKPFRAALEEKLQLAKYFYNKIKNTPGFETGPEPELSVVTFRYIPGKGNTNKFNELLIKEIHKDGRVFLTSTIIDGKFTFRLALLAFRTHLETIDLTIKILKEKVNYLLKKHKEFK